jgi:hypothetical protein
VIEESEFEKLGVTRKKVYLKSYTNCCGFILQDFVFFVYGEYRNCVTLKAAVFGNMFV